jgi:hypothetical protein
MFIYLINNNKLIIIFTTRNNDVSDNSDGQWIDTESIQRVNYSQYSIKYQFLLCVYPIDN